MESMAELPAADSNENAWLRRVGEEAIARGELAVCVLAGGMATRMGGVVKALVELAPGVTFLDVALGERERVREQLGRAPALWLMTSEPTNDPVRAALHERGNPTDVATFEQFVSLRLTEEGELFVKSDDGEPSVYATGHGDLPDALRASGLLDKFIERGGRYVWISNLDNLGARIDPALLGQHIESGAPMTVEVVDKQPGDTGGGPVTLDGKPIIAEHFRLPGTFDMDAVPVFNTNTFIADAPRLASFELDWTYVEVRKQVKAQGIERVAVQFERLLGEMTMAIPPRMQRVSRHGVASRFLGMKTRADMERERGAITKLVDSLGLGSLRRDIGSS
jgi:UTP--glucose-1-phosphate uridylyltransferase